MTNDVDTDNHKENKHDNNNLQYYLRYLRKTYIYIYFLALRILRHNLCTKGDSESPYIEEGQHVQHKNIGIDFGMETYELFSLIMSCLS